MTIEFLEKSSQDFSELLEVGQEPNKETFTAHSAVMHYHSSYFNKELKILLPMMIKIILKLLLNRIFLLKYLKIFSDMYIHAGIIETENMDTKTLFELIMAANKLNNDIIAKYPNLIFESTEFTSKSALISILNRDDLQMKESKIWDYLIKWRTSQNLTLLEKLEE
ncbi:hypothetical protein Glove_177g40 [Diversispora epigaea]|uniref:BTB domain-containing protein n=1 Tax=Diversispora epigaea TaxID=1348612 RepID=A0A397IWQ0_9GLOM|nr:hypothetical protein Glove_177g40 [Diversispora epigaea]